MASALVSEMLSHEFVSNDGMVQRTTFSSGMQVTVNFSKEKTYTVEGEEIEPLGYRLHSGNTGGEPVSLPEKPVPQAAELWLYLLVGILIGGGIAAIVIALLVRKRRQADMAMVTTKTAERSSAEGEMTDEK